MLSSRLGSLKPEDRLPEWQAVADKSIGQLIESGEISPESVQTYLKTLKAYRDSGESAE